VNVSFESVAQPQAELLDQRSVASRLLEYRIDENGLTAAAVRKQVGICAGAIIEHLSENEHAALLP
jgi:hypothetical protein